MNCRVLIIQTSSVLSPSNLSRCFYAGGIQWDIVNWESFSVEQLAGEPNGLIIPVAVPVTPTALQLFKEIRHCGVRVPVLAVLSDDVDETVLETVSATADDFLFHPIRAGELRQRILRLIKLDSERPDALRDRLIAQMAMAQIIGRDPAFLTAVRDLPIIAETDAPVLITGETGTGKDMCARAIHFMSSRCDFPFIPVDCGAVPDHLFENELFGHVRGAFTDAHLEQKGLTGIADGGTLFMDEVDALSPGTQAKLLRFIQDRVYKPLGADRFLRANVRLVVASNQDLECYVEEKRFRSDLFYRLNVLRIHLPPLRDRSADIPILAEQFVESLSGDKQKWLSAAAVRKLMAYAWPGNIRELHNVLQRAILLSRNAQIQPADIRLSQHREPAAPDSSIFKHARAAAVGSFERTYVVDVLRKHRGNITRAARDAGKERRAFGRLVKKYNINPRALE